MLHFNARSLSKNFDAIGEFISQLDMNFPIYGFSETWINKNTPLLFGIDIYNFYHSDRVKSMGGGVIALLVHNSFIVSVRSDPSLPCDLSESLFVESDFLSIKKTLFAL